MLAEDFRLEKPFTRWSGSEALVLAANSPWAKTLIASGDCGGAFVPRFVSGGPGWWLTANWICRPGKEASTLGLLCYSGNFAPDRSGEKIKANPPGTRYGLVLQKIRLPGPASR